MSPAVGQPGAHSRSDGALDSSLDRVSALDFTPPGWRLNHGPMACEALAALGFEDLIVPWADRFERSMGPAAGPIAPRRPFDVAWQGLFGDRRLLPEWLGYFDRAISDEGWRSTIRLWLPRLTPGLGAALFHGVIRTAHAARAIDRADTPPGGSSSPGLWRIGRCGMAPRVGQ